MWAREVAACGVVACGVATWATRIGEEEEEKGLPVAAVKKRRMAKKKAGKIELKWARVFEILLQSGAVGVAAKYRCLFEKSQAELMREKAERGQEARNMCENFMKMKAELKAETAAYKARVQALEAAFAEIGFDVDPVTN